MKEEKNNNNIENYFNGFIKIGYVVPAKCTTSQQKKTNKQNKITTTNLCIIAVKIYYKPFGVRYALRLRCAVCGICTGCEQQQQKNVLIMNLKIATIFVY